MAKQKKSTEQPKNEFVIFTDGSCNNLDKFNNGGWAYIAFEASAVAADKDIDIKQAYKVESGAAKKTTNNRIELTAICKAIASLPMAAKCYIFTDSEYCIKVLDHRDGHQFVANTDIINTFYQVIALRAISYSFHWIKGHSGYKFNELADQLAQSEYRKLNNVANGTDFVNNIPLEKFLVKTDQQTTTDEQ